jgi:hypothetical protein
MNLVEEGDPLRAWGSPSPAILTSRASGSNSQLKRAGGITRLRCISPSGTPPSTPEPPYQSWLIRQVDRPSGPAAPWWSLRPCLEEINLPALKTTYSRTLRP